MKARQPAANIWYAALTVTDEWSIAMRWLLVVAWEEETVKSRVESLVTGACIWVESVCAGGS